ncbi:22594_t:CDS:2, partial [Dentiscutata erythropus]
MSTLGDSGVNTSRNLRLRPRYAIVNVPPRAPQLTPSSQQRIQQARTLTIYSESRTPRVRTNHGYQRSDLRFGAWNFTLSLVNDTIIGGFQELFKCLNISVIRTDGKVVLNE